jgi:hypothetical protein
MRHPANLVRFCAAAGLTFLVLSCSTIAHAESKIADPFFQTTPFSTWLGTAPKPQIPWRVKILPARLSLYQRIHFRVFVQISGGQVLRHVPGGGFALMIQVTDARGNSYQDHVLFEPQDLKRGVKKGNLEVTENMLLLPGEYRLALALFDRRTGQYSFQERNVTVAGVQHDPLPNLWSKMPSVQFFVPSESGFKVLVQEPSLRYDLSEQNHRPIRLELLFDLDAPLSSATSRSEDEQWVNRRLAEIAPLSQIRLQLGSIRIELIDSVQGRKVFEQEDVHELDWRSLQSSMAAIDPTKIDAATLAGRIDKNVFLFRELQHRFDAAKTELPDGAKPLNAYVFVDDEYVLAPAPMTFPSGTDCVIYYIHTQPFSSDPDRDEARRRRSKPTETLPPSVPELFGPLHPRVLQVSSPEEFRAALAQILAGLSAY